MTMYSNLFIHYSFSQQQKSVYSNQRVKVQNLSRIALEYEIQIPKKYKDELYLEPAQGSIKPNETLFLECSFIPYRKKDYKIKVPMVVKELIDPQQNLIGYHYPGSGSKKKDY